MNKKLISSIIAVAMFAGAASQAAAVDFITITGNGSRSDSTVNIRRRRTSLINQLINNDIVNDVDVAANTGNNEIDELTGAGEASIDTGNSTTDVDITNTGGSNLADDDCGCASSEVDVLVSENGFRSDNTVDYSTRSNTSRIQAVLGRLRNRLDLRGVTGGNDIDETTLSSGGTAEIDTGVSNTDVNITNDQGSNTL